MRAHEHRVRALLMGGQACVFYGAAEFSCDTDFAILADAPTSFDSAPLSSTCRLTSSPFRPSN
jgi:hypothetical protein